MRGGRGKGHLLAVEQRKAKGEAAVSGGEEAKEEQQKARERCRGKVDGGGSRQGGRRSEAATGKVERRQEALLAVGGRQKWRRQQ